MDNIEFEKLREINKIQEFIISVLFHDLRGQFGSIDNIASILSNDYDNFSDNDRKSFLKTISSTSNQINTTIDSILTWAYFRMDKLHIESERVDIVKVINAVLEQIDNYIKSKNIKIKYKIVQEYIIKANEHLIYLSLLNIIHNAIKYSQKGSEVEIKIESIKDKFIINIADSGVGIKKANLSKLFKIPCDFKTNGTNGESGSGFGLIIAKDFLEATNATIKIESILKKGTVAKITLVRI